MVRQLPAAFGKALDRIVHRAGGDRTDSASEVREDRIASVALGLVGAKPLQRLRGAEQRVVALPGVSRMRTPPVERRPHLEPALLPHPQEAPR